MSFGSTASGASTGSVQSGSSDKADKGPLFSCTASYEKGTLPGRPSNPVAAPGKRVLIIDDDAEFGDYVHDLVTDAGCTALLLNRSIHFKTTFREFYPDVVILDVIMPEPDGIELLLWMAEQSCTAEIVVVSAYDQRYGMFARELAECSGLPSPVVLKKPFEPCELRNLIVQPAGTPANGTIGAEG